MGIFMGYVSLPEGSLKIDGSLVFGVDKHLLFQARGWT